MDSKKIDTALDMVNREKLKTATKIVDAEEKKLADRKEREYEDRLTWGEGDIELIEDNDSSA